MHWQTRTDRDNHSVVPVQVSELCRVLLEISYLAQETTHISIPLKMIPYQPERSNNGHESK